ncbi:unnamed protein product [Hymenolepis diminuta]|uniref:HTH cro/C1-type domain-containing protein n=1 Tax=Hymenolepis diminuta TaxID=6216 RepID=A0A0R3SES5_HYMDI|nr:unnamed protein product [Hymenolepis diminuta]VUZ46240.1 unnamed protein product [Hymenolepis diminuta]
MEPRVRPVNLKRNAALNIVARSGQEIHTEKKFAAGSNKQHDIKNLNKLEEDTEDFHHAHVSSDVSRLIAQGRQNTGLTQKELATKINEKPSIIADYEQGRAIPNQTILGKLERALNIKLRGKEKGAPLVSKTKK